MSYWLQLQGVFEEAGVNFPLVLPRMSVTFFSKQQAETWRGFGFGLDDITRSLHELYRMYLPEVWNAAEFDTYKANILSLMDALQGYIREDISGTLARSADALSTKTRHFLENLQKKAGKIKRQQHHEPFDNIRGLKRQIQPDGTVQERTLSLASFAPEVSPSALIDFLYQCCNPLEFEHLFQILPEG